MRVLFVSSGNIKNQIGIVVGNQAKSLVNSGADVSFFLVVGSGFYGYLRNVWRLKRYLAHNKVDVVHAHYGLCGFVACLAKGRRKLVISFMGSDLIVKRAESNFWKLWLIKQISLWASKRADQVIVKSQEMKAQLPFSNGVVVIPNGVDMSLFSPMDKDICRKKLGWSTNDFIILFLANPKRVEKNFDLANKGVQIFKEKIGDSGERVQFIVTHDVKNEELPLYYNGADVLLLTSIYEGSPNVIKEAMACNCSIISTKVGDVPFLLDQTSGNILIDQKEEQLALALIKLFSQDEVFVNSRSRLLGLELSDIQVASKLKSIYHSF
jgi:teichuronic acid biosynthesis glycosyltransferase TuaC